MWPPPADSCIGQPTFCLPEWQFASSITSSAFTRHKREKEDGKRRLGLQIPFMSELSDKSYSLVWKNGVNREHECAKHECARMV